MNSITRKYFHWNHQGNRNIGKPKHARRRELEAETNYRRRTRKELQEVETDSQIGLSWLMAYIPIGDEQAEKDERGSLNNVKLFMV